MLADVASAVGATKDPTRTGVCRASGASGDPVLPHRVGCLGSQRFFSPQVSVPQKGEGLLTANIPFRIPRMPASYLCYPTGLRILSPDTKMAPKSGLWSRHQHSPLGFSRCGKQSPATAPSPTGSPCNLHILRLPAFSAAPCRRKEKLRLQQGQQAGSPFPVDPSRRPPFCETRQNTNAIYHALLHA